jgi:hypothetical protein
MTVQRTSDTQCRCGHAESEHRGFKCYNGDCRCPGFKAQEASSSKTHNGAWCAEHGSSWKAGCPSCEGARAARIATQVVQNVCELPDYNSPDDQPDLVMCTVQELENCVLRAFEANAPETCDVLRSTLERIAAGHFTESGAEEVAKAALRSAAGPALKANACTYPDCECSPLDGGKPREQCGKAAKPPCTCGIDDRPRPHDTTCPRREPL